MKIKVCGMKEHTNIEDIISLKPDYLGLIFYDKSQRFVSNELNQLFIKNITSKLKVVGVFVNSDLKFIFDTVNHYSLSCVQLHGDEDSDFCQKLKTLIPETAIWKAIRVSTETELENIGNEFEVCSKLVFDTSCDNNFGGTGKSFDWKLLDKYNGPIKFFLSGGIGPENTDQAIEYLKSHQYGMGIDINSKVEIKPGLKSVSLVRNIINRIIRV